MAAEVGDEAGARFQTLTIRDPYYIEEKVTC